MSEAKRRAEEAKWLLGDQSPLPAVLQDIREDAQAAFLASGGDPELMAEAWKGLEAIDFLERTLRRRMNAGSVEEAAQRRKQRGKD